MRGRLKARARAQPRRSRRRVGIYGPDPERRGTLGGEKRRGRAVTRLQAQGRRARLYGGADGNWLAGRRRWSANGAAGGLGPLSPI